VAPPPNPQRKILVGFFKVEKSISEETWRSYHMKKESKSSHNNPLKHYTVVKN
jgi:hypothetical protein